MAQPKSEALAVVEPYLIHQNVAAYYLGQHAMWNELVSRRLPQLEQHAAIAYFEGFAQVASGRIAFQTSAPSPRASGPVLAGAPRQSAASSPLRCSPPGASHRHLDSQPQRHGVHT